MIKILAFCSYNDAVLALLMICLSIYIFYILIMWFINGMWWAGKIIWKIKFFEIAKNRPEFLQGKLPFLAVVPRFTGLNPRK